MYQSVIEHLWYSFECADLERIGKPPHGMPARKLDVSWQWEERKNRLHQRFDNTNHHIITAFWIYILGMSNFDTCVWEEKKNMYNKYDTRGTEYTKNVSLNDEAFDKRKKIAALQPVLSCGSLFPSQKDRAKKSWVRNNYVTRTSVMKNIIISSREITPVIVSP